MTLKLIKMLEIIVLYFCFLFSDSFKIFSLKYQSKHFEIIECNKRIKLNLANSIYKNRCDFQIYSNLPKKQEVTSDVSIRTSPNVLKKAILNEIESFEEVDEVIFIK
jgi:hypothetical protein